MTMPYVYIGANAGVGNMLFDEGITGHLGSSTIKGSSISPAKNTLGNTFEAWNNNFQGTPPSGTSSMIAVPFGFGQVASQYGDAARNVDFSAILYRVFLEDLTVSGRTFAAVSALDQSLYNAAFTSGGRYNGDTYTSPSTLP
ncbi:hypothetical protein DIE02_27720 [Burkholderia sp. Bp8991]|nr:hypothetical protein DIE02_27720 [Burkholderia sp. Bp8991]